MFTIYSNSSKKTIALVVLIFLKAYDPLFAQDNNSNRLSIDSTQKIGDIILFALPAATFGASFIIGDKEGAWEYTKGLLLTAGITYGLKYSINKERPDMSNDNSFPSGHTSTVFHSAGYIHRRYGLKYSIPAYALAGFTAASRIDANKHDMLDIAAGIVIGLGSNLLFTNAHRQKHIELTYSSSDGNYMIGLTHKF